MCVPLLGSLLAIAVAGSILRSPHIFSSTNVVTRVYDVRDLIIGDDVVQEPHQGAEGQVLDFSETAQSSITRSALIGARIIDPIQREIAPLSWKDNGGQVGSLRELSCQLIVTHTPAVHARIVSLLAEMRARDLAVNPQRPRRLPPVACSFPLLANRAATTSSSP
jgi:hypothetical protein